MGREHTSHQVPIGRADLGLSLLLSLLALIPRWVGLAGQRFIDDECFHAELARWPLSEIWQHCTTSVTMPGWFVPYHAWLVSVAPLFSSADLGARAFSLLAGCLVVTTTYWLGLLAAGRRVAVLAGAAAALSGYQIYFSQTATPYAALILVGALTALTLLFCLRGGSRPAALFNALLLGFSFYMHHTAALLWGAQVGSLLLLFWAGRGKQPHLRLAVAASLGGLLLAIPALALWWTQWRVLSSVGLPYVPTLNLAAVTGVLHDLAAYRSRVPLSMALAALFGCAAAAVPVKAAVSMIRGKPTRDQLLVVVGCVALLPLAVSLVAALLLADFFWYAPRYFAMFQASWAVLLAAAVSQVSTNAALGKARHALAALLVLSYLVPQASSIRFLNDEARTRENFPVEQVSAYLLQQSRDGDAALVHHSWYTLFFERYHRHPHPKIMGAITPGITDGVFGGTLEKISPATVKRTLARLTPYQRVFLILTPTKNSEGRDPHGLLQRTMDKQLKLVGEKCIACDTGDPVQIKLYELKNN